MLEGDITDEQLQEVADAMVSKALGLPRVVLTREDEEQYIRTMVQTCVLDTYLILTGKVPVEAYRG